jgi:hypothetical protein
MLRTAVLCLLVLASSGLNAQVAPPRRPALTPDDSAVVATEKSMWGMWKNRDAASFGALLADDFYDVYLDGTVVGKQQLLHDFFDAELLEYSFGPVEVVHLTPDAVVLVYRADLHGRAGATDIRRTLNVTSAWARRGGKWLSVFYRENYPPPAAS